MFYFGIIYVFGNVGVDGVFEDDDGFVWVIDYFCYCVCGGYDN